MATEAERVPSPWEYAAAEFDVELPLSRLQPKQVLAERLAQEADELLYGGAPYSGKTVFGLEHVISECQTYYGNQALILRRIYPSLQGVLDRLMLRLKGLAEWEAGKRRFVFPNRSIIRLGHLQYEDSIAAYQEASFGVVLFEELTEFLVTQFEGLRPWVRVPPEGSPSIHPHVIATTNPGGIGHSWVKRRFIKTREGVKLPVNEVWTAPPSDPEGAPMKRAFVPARTEDNPAGLAKDPRYLSRLRAAISNRGLRKAMTSGDWDAIDQTEDAKWEWAWLDEGRVEPGHLAFIRAHRRAVAIDPSDGLETGDEYGVWAGGIGTDGTIYTTHSFPLKGSPASMARATLDLYKETDADVLVAERNHGGRWLETVFKSLDPYVNFDTVWASEGKITRAEPVAALFEPQEVGIRFRARLEGHHKELEEEMTTFTGKPGQPSPDILDACIAKGTLIATSEGSVPIEEVAVGTKVWTREGWRRVEAKRLTRKKAEVLSVGLSSGEVLIGTSDHLVWTDRGWSRLDALVWGDRLSGWRSSGLSIGEPSMPGTPRLSGENTEPISILQEVRERVFSTGRSIRTITARSLRVGTFITLTGILRTTILIISRPYLQRITSLVMTTRISSLQSGWSIWRKSGRRLLSGIGLLKVEPGTGSTLKISGSGESLLRSSDARSVGKRLNHGDLQGKDSVLESVSVKLRIGSIVMTLGRSVPYAERSSGRTSTVRDPSSVPVSVITVRDAGKADVYDLQVEGVHEFVASGVIVHNCVWGHRYLMDGGVVILKAPKDPNRQVMGGTPGRISMAGNSSG